MSDRTIERGAAAGETEAVQQHRPAAPTASSQGLAALMAVDPASVSRLVDGEAQRASKPQTRVSRLSIVIPAKNESLGLPALLDELNLTLKTLPGTRTEVLVVDDGSTDGTGELARRKGAKVVRHPRSLGNGAAIKRGIREARGDWVLLMDADGQHPSSVIPRLIAHAEEHDMVVASRGGSGGSTLRNTANKVYNGLASYVTGQRIPDLTSGFRLIRADVLKSLVYLLPNTFSYPTTITLAMMRAGYSVEFEPFQVRQRQGKSHIKLLEDGSRFLLIIMRIATIFAPLRVFVPLSLAMGGLGLLWYLVTFATSGRFTNMSLMLFTQASVVFALGLVSEQVAALRYSRIEEDRR